MKLRTSLVYLFLSTVACGQPLVDEPGQFEVKKDRFLEQRLRQVNRFKLGCQ